MSQKLILPDAEQLAWSAAETTLQELRTAIQTYGQACWVIAGGSTPLAAYRILAEHYADAIDWTKIIVVIGDERCVPFDSPDANWSQFADVFLKHVKTNDFTARPATDQPAEAAAGQYAGYLKQLPQTADGLPRFDLMWLGIGEDGHTLSLFPGHDSSRQPTGELVIAVHDAPKPPPNRISLSFKALQGVACALIMSAGAGKAAAIGRALDGDISVPVAKAAETIEAAGGTVIWLFDQAAADLKRVKA